LDKFDPRSVDGEAQLLDLERADCEENLYEFFKAAWSIIDPAPWVDGWCIDAICEHLQAVVDGQIRNLLINISPRCSKSNLCSVTFPAWVWVQPKIGPVSGPQVSFLHTSYAKQLVERDSGKRRRLIESPWYQARWGGRFQLLEDQNTKARFRNDKGGESLISSVVGANTGEGAMCIINDDNNSVDDVDSEASIQTVIDWWDGVMPTRLNNQNTGARIVIQQRTFENDLTGHILETEMEDWVHLMIPMKYEPERSYPTVTGWKDPRTEPGELMWPERFNEQATTRLEKRLGPFRAAGQLQQRPEPKGGGLIRREWWRLWDAQSFPPMDFVLAWLDTAYTEHEINDPSGMIIWGIYSGDVSAATTRIVGANGEPLPHASTYSEFAPRVMCMYAWTERLELHELVKKSAEVCTKMKVDVLVIENKASGISVAQELRRLYSRERFSVQLADPGRQDKVARLISVQHIFAEGMVYGPDRAWMEKVIAQVGQFPKGKHDEYADCTSGGLKKLRDMGLLVRQPEREAELEADRQYRGREEPLYSV
jgi:predicted phage terminase large subunit-like protein